MEKPKERKYKSRLFVGEGNFTYSKSLVKKHEVDKPGLGKAIIATEYDNEENLAKEEGFKETVDYLKKQDVTIKYGVDGRYLDKNQFFKNKRFKRIHFNCPFVSDHLSTNELVKKFFKHACGIQEYGDKIYMFLKDDNVGWQLGRTYNLFDASAKAGYVLKERRKFNKTRYPAWNPHN